MIDPRWDFLINRAIVKHLTTGSVATYVEGENRLTDREPEYIEIRVTGPDYTEISRNQTHIEVYVNCVVNVCSPTSIYRVKELAGQVAAKMSAITVMDDSVIVGCLKPIGEVITRHLGLVDRSISLNRAIIDAAYEMDL